MRPGLPLFLPGGVLLLAGFPEARPHVNEDRIRKLLSEVREGGLSVEAAVKEMSRLPFVDTGSARVDTHRALRHGIPEVIFGLGKTPDQVVEIAAALAEAGQPVLVTRIAPDAAAAAEAAGEEPISPSSSFGSSSDSTPVEDEKIEEKINERNETTEDDLRRIVLEVLAECRIVNADEDMKVHPAFEKKEVVKL